MWALILKWRAYSTEVLESPSPLFQVDATKHWKYRTFVKFELETEIRYKQKDNHCPHVTAFH